MKSMHLVFKSIALSLLILGSTLTASALAGEKVDINTADAAALDRVLTNVGPVKAAKIVEYREENGPFRSAEELALVNGIGLKTVEKNLDMIEVGGVAASGSAAGSSAAR